MNIARSVLALALGSVLLGACSTQSSTSDVSRNAPFSIELPAMKSFAGSPAPAPARSNASIAKEFMTLVFELESGRKLPVMSRFEGPITIRVTGNRVGPATERDIDRLLFRLRSEARIPITRVRADQSANITVEVLSRRTLRRAVPQAACFVAPNVESWAEFKLRRLTPGLDWTALVQRDRMAVFLPGDVSAQEIRDCLHEEVAQALGPVNDLYHLTDSIFNDDNFHTVLTGFDMVILRAVYDPGLRSGMTPQAVARRLPGILARINPAGRFGGVAPTTATPRQWSSAIEAALGARSSVASRLTSAKRAVSYAKSQGWNDNRLGFSLYAQGRLALSNDTALAISSFAQAEAVFRADPETRLHGAHVAVQAAAYALSAGRPGEAIEIANGNSPTALAAENASLLSTLLMIKAQALDTLGRHSEAGIVRSDSLGWARYGIGSDAEIRARLQEIAALVPRIEANAAP